MGRLFVNILLVACFALPSWGRHIHKTAVVDSKVGGHEYNLMLDCDTSADTTYSITLWDDGHVYRSEDAMLLLKLGDGTVIELNPSDRSCIQEIDSMYYNNEGKAVFINRNEMLYYYPINIDDLHHIFKSGIVKVRIGIYGETVWAERTWKRDEWGKELAKAYAEIQKQLVPGYVPPKKPTIRDGF